MSAAASRPKPPNAGKGRKKGSQNKTTAAVKEALSHAFHGIGGARALQDWATENKTEFFKLWAKMLPAEVQGEMQHSGDIVIRVIRQAGGGSARGA